MIKTEQNMKKEVFIKYMGVFLILALTLYNIRDLDMIHVLHDEYGYWAAAAFFAGKDWSAVTAYTSYYSYGYGLLLAPLMFFMNNASYMYKAAIILNAIMLVISYFIAVACIRKLFKEVEQAWAYIIALVCTIYSNNLIQAQITWAETLLYLLFWIITWLIISIYEKPTELKMTALAAATVYSYMVHQRSLGVVVAVILLITVLKLVKKLNWKQMLVFAIVFMVVLLFHVYLKDLVKTELYLDGVVKTMSANDFGGQTGKLAIIFSSLDGFIRAIIGFVGKTFYLSAASLGIAIVGTYYALKKTIQHKDELLTYICAFVFLSTLFSLGINTIFMVNGQRLDCVMYGRYTEFIIGPVLVLGFIVLLNRLVHIKELVIIFGLTIVSGGIVAIYMQQMDTLDFNSICCVGIYLFFRGITNRIQPFIRMLPILFLILLVFCFLYSAKLKQNKKQFMMFVVSVCSVFWMVTSVYLGPLLEVYDFNEIKKITDIIRQYDNHETIKIEYISDKNDIDGRFIEYFRFLLPDAEINYHPIESMSSFDENAWILRNTEDEFYLLNEFNIAARWDTMDLMIKNDSFIAEQMDENNLFYYGKKNSLNIMEEDVMSQNRNENHLEWSSNGTEGYFVYGPYMFLGKGDYQLELDLTIDVDDKTQLGKSAAIVDIYNNSEVIAEMLINQEGKMMVEIPFIINESKDSVEFRIKTEEGCLVRIDTMKLLKK